MELKQGQLNVYYNEGDLNQELDKALEHCLKKFGYTRWASGMAMQSWIRDIAFEKDKE
jgi:hypothetical protein